MSCQQTARRYIYAKKKDSIMQTVLEYLCNKHNKEIMQYENTQPFVEDCNVLYQGGYEDGQAYGYDLGYEDGYKDGYKRAVTDIDSTRG